MYRLMKTAKVIFLNDEKFLENSIDPFTSSEDIILHKKELRTANRSNQSTYATRGENGQLQIFGKTYGASKYETTLICLAISAIETSKAELYQIAEGGLTELPSSSKNAIKALGVIKIYTSNDEIESANFKESDSLRSPEYIYNLLEKLGDKKCAFCACNIPQIIEGAHIWPVANIKRDDSLSDQQKLSMALDGDNGLWLCRNHHKLLDSSILRLSKDRVLSRKKDLNESQVEYINEITVMGEIPAPIFNEKFVKYLSNRNTTTSESRYTALN